MEVLQVVTNHDDKTVIYVLIFCTIGWIKLHSTVCKQAPYCAQSTLQLRPRCTVWIFNSSPAVGLGAKYGLSTRLMLPASGYCTVANAMKGAIN